ncbi:sensor histidine kinase [Egbenema bharatensis]|uniref:sensor histidine kinase n=1 Tax=Egbenema bharatensis TaxID=3463334 RepID=UPI003A8AAE53
MNSSYRQPEQPSHRRLTREGGNSQILPQISLRTKLLVGFSVVFTLVFAGTFFWFYAFATERTLSYLRTEMRSTLQGAAEGVDVDELLALYAEGDRNAAGFSDDPRYERVLDWFDQVHRIQPRAWLYTYVVGRSEQNRRYGPSAVQPGELEIIYLVDLWAAYDPTHSSYFLESDRAGAAAHEVLRERRLVEEPEIYTDRWGSWLSAAMPLFDEEGNVAAVLGLDIEADRILEVQQAIRDRVLIAFLIAYGVLGVLLYLLSGILTKHLDELTRSAKHIGSGDYDLNISFAHQEPFPDELTILAQVLECMVDSIRTREEQIKESQRIEYETRLALAEERELNDLKSRFVSMVSHELRTPLTVIRTSIELLEKYGHLASEEKRKDYYTRCHTAINNMTQLLEDVLTINRAEAGRLEFKPTPIHLSRFCQDLIEEATANSSDLTHSIQFHSQGECNTVRVDPVLLRSILLNLLSNALKYSPVHQPIEFTLNCSEDVATFVIQDHGIGIPTTDQPHIFDLFYRAGNVSTIRGTGLGLAIVRQCVELHQGKITVHSQEEKGTWFTVLLPISLS